MKLCKSAVFAFDSIIITGMTAFTRIKQPERNSYPDYKFVNHANQIAGSGWQNLKTRQKVLLFYA